MFRKLFIFLILGSIAAAIAYGYLYYGVVVIYTNNPKISVVHLVEKPERSTEFFYSNINKGETEKKVRTYLQQGKDVPWYMVPEKVKERSIYQFIMDTR